MLMIWPKESNLDDLLKETLEEGETWDKGEAYMIKLVSKDGDNNDGLSITSLLPRLKIWKFRGSWDEEKLIVDEFYKKCMHAQNQI
jgi:hypothetical protein